MNIQKVKLNKLKTNLNNIKYHNKKNIEAIKKSLIEYNQYSPLIVNENTFEILKGVGTYLAMKKLKWKQCYVNFVNLTENQQNELIVLDNRTSQLSELNQDKIEQIFYNLEQDKILFTGFDENEVDELMNKINQNEVEDQTEKINLVKIKCPYCGNQFSE